MRTALLTCFLATLMATGPVAFAQQDTLAGLSVSSGLHRTCTAVPLLVSPTVADSVTVTGTGRMLLRSQEGITLRPGFRAGGWQPGGRFLAAISGGCQSFFVWNGSVSTDWGNPANWTPNGIPDDGDTVKIGTSSKDPVLDRNRTVARIHQTHDTLHLGGHTLTVMGTCDLRGDLVDNGKIIQRGAATDTTRFLTIGMACKTDLESGKFLMTTVTFGDSTRLSRIGWTYSNYSITGGNKYLGHTELVNKDSSIFYFGNLYPDSFMTTLDVINLSKARITLCYRGGDANYFGGNVRLFNLSTAPGSFIDVFTSYGGKANFAGDVTIAATGGAYIIFRDNGEAIIAAGKTIRIDTTIGYSANYLHLRNVTQLGAADIDLRGISSVTDAYISHGSSIGGRVLTSGAKLFRMNDSQFLKDVDVSAGAIVVTGSTFHGDANLSRTGWVGGIGNARNRFKGDLTFTNEKTVAGTTYWGYNNPDTVEGNLTLTNKGVQHLMFSYSRESFIGGNVTLKADSTGGIYMGYTTGRMVTLNGSGNQVWTSLSSNKALEYVYDVRVNKPSGEVLIPDELDVRTSLNMFKGNIRTFGSGQVKLRDNAVVTGASDSSYVQGPVLKVGNDAFTFPVGENGVYRPLAMTAPNTTSAQYIVKHVRKNPNRKLGMDKLDASLNYVTPLNYWEIERLASTSNVKWAVSWRPSDSYIFHDPDSAVVAGWNGTGWKDLGNEAVTGDSTLGTVRSSTTINPVTYSALALGSQSARVLPAGLNEANIVLNSEMVSDTSLGSISISVEGGVSPVRIMLDSVILPDADWFNDLVLDSALKYIFLDSVDIATFQEELTGREMKDLPSRSYTVTVYDGNQDTISYTVKLEQKVLWKDTVGLEVSGGAFNKSGGDGWDNGALTFNFLDSLSDGYFTLRIDSVNHALAMGFREPDTNGYSNYTQMDHAIVVEGGQVKVWSGDSLYTLGIPATAGSILKVERIGSNMHFRLDGDLLMSTSEVAPKMYRGQVSVYRGGSLGGSRDGSILGTWLALNPVKHVIMPVTCDEPDAGSVRLGIMDAPEYTYTVHRNGILIFPTITTTTNSVQLSGLSAGQYHIHWTNGTLSGSYTFFIGHHPEWAQQEHVLTSSNTIWSTSPQTYPNGWESHASTSNFIAADSEGWAVMKPRSINNMPMHEGMSSIGFSRYPGALTPIDMAFGMVVIRIGGNAPGSYVWLFSDGQWVQSFYVLSGHQLRLEKVLTVDGYRFRLSSGNFLPTGNTYGYSQLLYESVEFPADVHKLYLATSMSTAHSGFKDLMLNFGCDTEFSWAICEDDLTRNWVDQMVFDDDQVGFNFNLLSHSRAYYDDFGRPTQSQSKLLEEADVLASEVVYDQYGRGVLTTLPAPISQTDFCYKEDFITNASGQHYSYADFNLRNRSVSPPSLSYGEVDKPKPVGDEEPNTLGWYYSNNNGREAYVPASGFPYKRIEYDDRNPDRVRRSVMAGESLQMGGGHESILNVVPIVGNELSHYLAIGLHFTDNEVQSLAYEGWKHISTDPNGKIGISYYDRSGNLMAECVDAVYPWDDQEVVVHAGNPVFMTTGGGNYSTEVHRAAGETFNDFELHGHGHIRILRTDIDTVIYSGLKSGVNKGHFDTSYTYILQSSSSFTLFYERESDTDTVQVIDPATDGTGTESDPEGFTGYRDLYIPDSLGSNLSFNRPEQWIKVVSLANGDSVYEGLALDMPELKGGVYRFIPDTMFVYNIPSDSLFDLDVKTAGTYTLSHHDKVIYSGGENYWDSGLPPTADGAPYTLRATKPCEVSYDRDGEDDIVHLPLSSFFMDFWLNFLFPPQHCAYHYYDNADRHVVTVPPLAVFPMSTALPHMFTRKWYDSLGRLLQTDDPDAGTAKFVYDNAGRLRFSQNAKQVSDIPYSASANPELWRRFNYIEYDHVGRVTETGEYAPGGWGAGDFFFEEQYEVNIPHDDENAISIHWAVLFPELAQLDQEGRQERSHVMYDLPDPDFATTTGLSYAQRFTMGRVSRTWNDNTSTWYGYDYRGRLEWCVKKVEGMDAGVDGNGIFTMHYTYNDRGEVTQVEFQRDEATEAFTHWYTYDKDGRLKKAEAGRDGTDRAEVAEYSYYVHGPLKRVELANGLQGVDYVHTINGWLKSINDPELADRDPGGDDGATADLFGMTLDYFNGDYRREGTHVQTYDHIFTSYPAPADLPFNLYDGTIKAQRWRHAEVGSGFHHDGEQLMYAYRYDNKYQLKSAKMGLVTSPGNQNFDPLYPPSPSTGYIGPGVTMVNDYKEEIPFYDANGNIWQLKRNGYDGNLDMDDLSYTYTPAFTNTLTKVADAVSGTPYATDIASGQGADNYMYDELGQQTADVDEGRYTAYNGLGLVSAIYANVGHTIPVVSFTYDDKGQRLKKTSYESSSPYDPALDTWYIRDDGGNIISIYEMPYDGGDPLSTTQTELNLFGASRVGVWHTTGERAFELMDHLGNVRATFRDYSGLDRLSVMDYYPFGWNIPGRTMIGGFNYRFGYQGQFAEKDDETDLSNFEARVYDTRLGRWLSPDPLRVNWSPYMAMGNNPLNMVDPDGRKEYPNDFVGPLNQGDWYISDRLGNSAGWQNANVYNLTGGAYWEYNTISQRADFYSWLATDLSNRGFETMWVGAASVVAGQMALMDSEPLVAALSLYEGADVMADVVAFANKGNRAIFNDVYPKLSKLYTGAPLKGQAARSWDNVTLRNEQYNVVGPIYRVQSKSTISVLESMAKGKGIYGLGLTSALRFEGNLLSPSDRFNHGASKVTNFYRLQTVYRQAGW